MLKLELTDGHSTVIAMECSPITCLNTKLLPGTKISIKGENIVNSLATNLKFLILLS